MNQTDRRKQVRFPVNIEVRFRPLTPGARSAWRRGLLLSAGTGGVFIAVARPCPKRQVLELELPLQSGPTRVRARVQWSSSAPPRGMGVTFQRLGPSLRAQIAEQLKSGTWLKETCHGEGKPEFFTADIQSLLRYTVAGGPSLRRREN